MKKPQILLTEKEIKAISDYTGYEHTKINWLADMEPCKYEYLSQKGWILDSSTETIEKQIEKFVDIYAAIYKQGETTASGRLFKGTNKREARLKRR